MGLTKDTSAREQAQERLSADTEHADRLPALLEAVARCKDALNQARAAGAPVEELNRHGRELDTALTGAMRAAYAKERVLVGPKGYTDRIHRRKRLAHPRVKEATQLAERLLTEREAHRLHGIDRVPPQAV